MSQFESDAVASGHQGLQAVKDYMGSRPHHMVKEACWLEDLAEFKSKHSYAGIYSSSGNVLLDPMKGTAKHHNEADQDQDPRLPTISSSVVSSNTVRSLKHSSQRNV